MSTPTALRRLVWRIWRRFRPLPSPPAGPTYYYQIVAVTRDGEERETAPPAALPDQEVTLTWHPTAEARWWKIYKNGTFVSSHEIRGDEEDA